MSYPFDPKMDEILALTRAGKLADATAMIQRSLGASGSEQPSTKVPIDIRPHGPLALPGPIDLRRPCEPEARAARSPVAGQGSGRRSFRGAAGSLEYLLHLPSHGDEPMPLVIMLHGCTQSAEDFARGTKMNALADELGFIVAYPEQTKSANMQKCWNWFRQSDQSKASGEPAVIAGITREIIANHPVDPGRVYVAGLSAGGAAAAIMAHAFPDIYAAAGIHSGLACGSAKDLPGAFAAMQGNGQRHRPTARQTYVPIITFHGDRDSTVHPTNSDQIHAAWESMPAIAGLERKIADGKSQSGSSYRKIVILNADGRSMSESWSLKGAGHAWSGGSPTGSYTYPQGPDASREMLRFFLQHRLE